MVNNINIHFFKPCPPFFFWMNDRIKDGRKLKTAEIRRVLALVVVCRYVSFSLGSVESGKKLKVLRSAQDKFRGSQRCLLSREKTYIDCMQNSRAFFESGVGAKTSKHKRSSNAIITQHNITTIKKQWFMTAIAPHI